jgi:alkylation response protein AidB-like acyl-CoA dehydrogenase
MGEARWLERTLYLQVPKDASGVTFKGHWDPLGIRVTLSRDIVLQEVFAEAAAKGYAIAEMLFTLEAARALYYRAISAARVDPPFAAVHRAV